MNDELLIELVREKNELYDFAHSKYCDTSHKVNVWKEIGGKLQQGAGKCKQRWESLRSQFRKHVRNRRSKTGDQCGSSVIWRYGENLQFLLPYMKEKTRISSLDGSEVKEEEGEVSQESNEPIAQVTLALQKRTGEQLPNVNQDHVVLKTSHCQGGKREFLTETVSSTPMKHKLSKQKKEEGIDDYDLFFDTMKKTIKKFSPADKLLVKRRLFNIVAEIEDKYVAEQHPIFQPQTQQIHMENMPHSFTPYSRTSRLQSSPPCYEDTTNQSATTLSSESRPSSAGIKTEVKEEENLIIEDDEQGCRLWLKEASDPQLLYPNVTLLENDPPPAKQTKLGSYSKGEISLKNKENSLQGLSARHVTPAPDEFEALGIIWASKLRSLEETQKVLAEDLINQILKKGFFKELTRKSCVDKVS